MTARDFAYWLNGFLEMSDAKTLSEAQMRMLRAHLALVFAHDIDPAAGSAEHQEVLDAIHDLEKRPVPWYWKERPAPEQPAKPYFLDPDRALDPNRLRVRC